MTIPVGPHMKAIPLEITDHGEWEIRSKRGDLLGYVDYYKPWRQHVFNPEPNTVLSHDCLAALVAFLRAPPRRPSPPAGQQVLL